MYDNYPAIILVEILKDYNPNGRNQTKEEAILIDAQVKDLLDDNLKIPKNLKTNKCCDNYRYIDTLKNINGLEIL